LSADNQRAGEQKEQTRAQAILQEGAHMAHTTPCYRYCYEFSRFHLYFFTGRSLEFLGKRTHLRIEDTEYSDTKLFIPNR
jgi:hypothetical protein